MHCMKIILGLAAAVSAIDISFWSDYGCNGYVLTCAARNPGDCCWIDYAWPSIAFTYIPTSWHLVVGGYYDDDCQNLAEWAEVLGSTSICLWSYGPFASAEYLFVTKKGATAEAAKELEAPKSDKVCKKPDLLELGDGRNYTLGGLDDSQYDELLGLVVNGTDVAIIEQFFEKVEKRG